MGGHARGAGGSPSLPCRRAACTTSPLFLLAETELTGRFLRASLFQRRPVEQGCIPLSNQTSCPDETLPSRRVLRSALARRAVSCVQREGGLRPRGRMCQEAGS